MLLQAVTWKPPHIIEYNNQAVSIFVTLFVIFTALLIFFYIVFSSDNTKF